MFVTIKGARALVLSRVPLAATLEAAVALGATRPEEPLLDTGSATGSSASPFSPR
jgi:hypothetical protein